MSKFRSRDDVGDDGYPLATNPTTQPPHPNTPLTPPRLTGKGGIHSPPYSTGYQSRGLGGSLWASWEPEMDRFVCVSGAGALGPCIAAVGAEWYSAVISTCGGRMLPFAASTMVVA